MVVVLVSTGLAGFAVYALSDAERMSVYLPVVAAAYDQELDGADWKKHWVAWALGYLLFSCLGLVAGAGLWAKRLWGLAVLAGLFTLILGAQSLVLATGYSKYAFEVQGLLDLVPAAVLACLLWPWFFIASRRASR